jgi:uncharacterized protein YbbC (DUF1343 family)
MRSALALLVLVLLAPVARAEVKTGLDVLEAEGFARLKDKKVGLLVNHTARTRAGAWLPELLVDRKDLKLVTIFTPEHGLEGKKDEPIASGAWRGVPVVSLYGERKKPTADELRALDVLVFDIQDVGARYYTYLATLAMVLETAKETKTKVIVLDRPNPAGGEVVEGPLAEPALTRKFTSWSAIPTRHGLTIGEWGRWVNEVEKVGADLEVVKMEGWKRADLWADTGLEWRPPSPNLRTPEAALLYTGLGVLEQTNLSVGRGTDEPFLVYGAPFVDGERWAKALNDRKLDGVTFEPVTFTPRASAHAKKECRGVRVKVTDAHRVRTVTVVLHMLETLRALAKDWKPDCGSMLGERDGPSRLAKEGVDALLRTFETGRSSFEESRAKVLLYR